MKKAALLYEGKAKKMYATDDEQVVWAEYIDQATALNGAKKVAIAHKGTLNNQISGHIFNYLKTQGIESAFIQQMSETEQIMKKVQIIPLETVVRNLASGHFETKFNVAHLMKFKQPIVEFYYKSDALDDPFINDAQIVALDIATPAQIAELKQKALTVNTALKQFFADIDITLVDFKLEFGLDFEGNILLADEISPDTARLIDQKTGKSLDKDVFRKGLGDLRPGYEEVLKRIEDKERAINVLG
ncbi:phosphoribosylaminoimidazole-succinocarboxamide synthase [Agrilactobacillus composti DSM 18527 = JCM 14202]|uniref:Phosphoribosylaminoimidazole-succinocarboxamide synthase n=1 Tax=Agrilactobacillus composti DSM 18527 = JCM 14202 TaxID=1423734 RepID=A0A0R1XSR4_9LACO|nr:phosphoribosylaminoimidazolesuccinocarboxamide synthase [Agrilactobacillus composti]KRM33344.1 phosphoribosylaminoimidazole-succinocarboxamide synthase [Agrilactobacillus composti DSM 18527 = JCM 14202]